MKMRRTCESRFERIQTSFGVCRKKNGVIRGGMLVKADSAVEALKDGVGSVHIISGKKPSTLLAEVFTEVGSGTMIHRGIQPVKGRSRKKVVRPAGPAKNGEHKAAEDKPAAESPASK